METERALPPIRRIDVVPFQNDDGELYLALRDLAQIATRPIAVSLPAYFVISQLDGRNSTADIQRAFLRQFSQRMPTEQILKLIEALDQALLLQNERFETAYEERRAAYLLRDARDNRGRWPEVDSLRRQIETLLSKGKRHAPNNLLRGLIAPHLDYARGAPCYADAYKSLEGSDRAERYIILGTNHFGRSSSVVATRKDFVTPLGNVPTDRDAISRIESRLAASICEHELDHEFEHSVELQVHILQVINDEHPFEIVPILCPDPSGSATSATRGAPDRGLPDFITALREIVAKGDRRTILIAGADLSHVGRQFGEQEKTTPEFLERIRSSDAQLLTLLERRDEEAFVERIRATSNPTRICSVGCIYTLLRALPESPCQVIRYHQAVDLESETHVTCAAAILG